MALPEFLTGTPFQRYQFEGTVVTAFAMAVLQELNSRNVQNPISLLRSEVEYPVDRAKRADLPSAAVPIVFSRIWSGWGCCSSRW